MNSITVVYLKKNILLDISTENEKQDASRKITKLILKRVKPLYSIILVNIYGLAPSEQMFREVYECVNSSVDKYVYSSVYDYLSENNNIDIEGFILFRLKGLWDIIDTAAQEYLSLKDEYRILTEILKETIDKSQSICDTVTVIADTDNYSVYDDNMNVLAFVKKYDDTLLDIILNIAPSKIYICGKENFSSNTLLESIMAVFKEKVIMKPSE